MMMVSLVIAVMATGAVSAGRMLVAMAARFLVRLVAGRGRIGVVMMALVFVRIGAFALRHRGVVVRVVVHTGQTELYSFSFSCDRSFFRRFGRALTRQTARLTARSAQKLDLPAQRLPRAMQGDIKHRA